MAYDNSRPTSNEPSLPRRVVHTRLNTPFAAWKQMVLEECAKQGIDPETIRPMAIQHAWETDDTPGTFVDIYVRRKAKDQSRGR